jgi:hypothetical protein
MTIAADYTDILQYLVRFWRAMDRADYEEVLRGLTTDARWRRDRWSEGHADILEALQQRNALLVSSHSVTNLVIEPNGDGCDCRYSLIIFGHNRATAGEPPPYATSGPRMGDWQSRLVKQNGAWLASEITAQLLFERR